MSLVDYASSGPESADEDPVAGHHRHQHNRMESVRELHEKHPDWTYKQYAEKLGISRSAVTRHMKEIRMSRKLRARSICAAARFGETGQVVALIEAGADVNWAESGRMAPFDSPLLEAVQGGHTEVVAVLVKAGVDVNKATPGKRHRTTPLIAAAQGGHTEIVALLIKAGVDVNKAEESFPPGATALHKAAWEGYTEIVALLIKAGANVNVTHNWVTPLARAAQSGHTDTTRLLCVYGAERHQPFLDIESVTYEGHADLAAWLEATEECSGFWIALSLRLHRDAMWLLRHGYADPDDDPLSALRAAASPAGGWRDAPENCAATMALAKAATSPWSTQRHWLFHAGVRSSIEVLMLCRLRLGRADAQLPKLPVEIWWLVASFLRRRFWPVPGREDEWFDDDD